MQGGHEQGRFTHGKQSTRFADLLLFTSGERDEATSPSFVKRCAPIEASSVLLEALIASSLPAGGTEK